MSTKKRLALLSVYSILVGSTTPVLTSAQIFKDTQTHCSVKENMILYGKGIEKEVEKNVVKTKKQLDTQLTLPYKQLTNPVNSRWATTIEETISIIGDGELQVVSGATNDVIVNTYSREGKMLDEIRVSNPLDIYGGFYEGENYNYIVYGRENRNEDDNIEMLRVVKYDKQFREVGYLSLTGGDIRTTVPFDAGSLRMAEEGDKLVVHTSRERYTSPKDGKNHQSQLTLEINTKDMSLIRNVEDFQDNHVSHSFNQFVHIDGKDNVFVDHGDAYPRSIVLQKGSGKTKYKEVDVYNIPGHIGANQTGVFVGGFEISEENYIVAFNTVNHELVTDYDSFNIYGEKVNQRDIMLAIIPRNDLSEDSIQCIKLSNYEGTENSANPPHLVKINDNKFAVLWEEYNYVSDISKGGKNIVKYMIVNGDGETMSEIQTAEDMQLSNCQPIYSEGNIIWITDEKMKRTLYTLGVE